MAKGSDLALDILECTMRSGEEGTEQAGEEETKQSEEEEKKQCEDRNKWTCFVAFQWIVLVCFVGLLIATLTVAELKNQVIWGLELWKWCVLVIIIFCSGIFSKWMMMTFTVFAASGKHIQQVKVMYFVDGLRKSVQLLVWFGLVLAAWSLLFDAQVKRSEKTMRILKGITRGLAASLLGAFLWFLKSLLVKFVGSKFQGNRFFLRIRKGILRKHMLAVLARPDDAGKSFFWTMSELVDVTTSVSGKTLSVKVATDDDEQRTNSIWKALNPVFRGSSSSYEIKKITDKIVAKDTAAIIFKKLIKQIPKDESQAQKSDNINTDSSDKHMPKEKNQAQKSENRDIEEIFNASSSVKQMSKEKKQAQKSENKNIDTVGIRKKDFLSYFHETKGIKCKDVLDGLFSDKKKKDDEEIITIKSFKKWLVDVYEESICLPGLLKDNNTAVEELNRVLSSVLLVVIIIAWLLVMGFLSTNVLLYISAQLLVASFIFSNTVKTVFEAMVFVFVAHPFDVNDRCIIENQKLIVNEMNLLTTIFQNQDDELIYYPNSVLATKPIINIYRSQKFHNLIINTYRSQKFYKLSDTVLFVVDASTTVAQINKLEKMIKEQMGKESMFKKMKMVVEDFDDDDKIKICVYFSHAHNKCQSHRDEKLRRSKFILKLKEILEQVQIKNYCLPKD